MPLFPSDFKKFQHVSNDKDTVTLRHPAGHQIIIARNAIKGDLRKQLDALCEGGKVEKKSGGGLIEEASRKGYLGGQRKVTQDISDERSSRAEKQTVDTTSGDVRTDDQKSKAAAYDKTGVLPDYVPQKKAEGGRVKLAYGTPETTVEELAKGQTPSGVYSDPFESFPKEPTDQERLSQRYNGILTAPSSPFAAGKGEAPADTDQMVGPNGETPKSVNTDALNQAIEDRSNEASAKQITEQQQMEAAQSQQNAQNQLAVGANSPTQVNPADIALQQAQGLAGPANYNPSVNVNTSQADINDPLARAQTGYNRQLQSYTDTANAQTNQAKENAEYLKANVEASQAAKEAYTRHAEELGQERQSLIKDIQDGQIDPEKFWNNHSRIATGIGMILSGFNPTNMPNAGLDYLNKQMDMNLDAQKANLASKRSLLTANLEQFRNLKDATEMTRIQQNDIIAHQLQAAANNATSPLAKAAAMEASGKLMQDSANRLFPLVNQSFGNKIRAELSDPRVAAGSRKEDPATYVRYMVPEEHQKQVYSEIQAAQDTKAASTKILRAFDEATKENTAMRTGFGMLREPGSVMALHTELGPTFKDVEGTVRQAAMDNVFKNTTPQAGDSEHKLAQKRAALQAYITSKSSAPTAKGFGIDLNKFNSTSTGISFDRANGSSNTAPRFTPRK